MTARAPEPAGDAALVVTLTRGDLRSLLREELDRCVAEIEAPPALITQGDLARHLGVSDRTVFELRKQGLPTVWICESPRFELATCLEWLRARRAPEKAAS